MANFSMTIDRKQTERLGLYLATCGLIGALGARVLTPHSVAIGGAFGIIQSLVRLAVYPIFRGMFEGPTATVHTKGLGIGLLVVSSTLITSAAAIALGTPLTLSSVVIFAVCQIAALILLNTAQNQRGAAQARNISNI